MEQEKFIDLPELRMLAKSKAQHTLHRGLTLVNHKGHTAHVFGFTTLDLLAASIFAQEANLLLASQPYRTTNDHILFFTPTSRLELADIIVGFKYDDNNNPSNVRQQYSVLNMDVCPTMVQLTPPGTDWKPCWE
ncbi:hypothetical protein vBValSR12Z_66 [Vibrio phage vB_ValS_R12Z]|uniref:Uncharacterized protein n=7 Tax=root TaxID=1 RepID=A0A384X9P2_9CAUD|nr:hypothetical protein [Vibrio alginolyticus]YP_009598656.1 hypothetical protein FDH27_gp065 [Vibrio phage SSP002]ATI19375.1 hypothetical protein KF5_065 [Vibrio phage vB_VpaS_KF5]ATI19469.1 hypothetical protein KF6_061 [Vibrio phage vB_VpaS_KF6]AUM58737.1 hypothetical protein VVP001_037 [Vibrio phage VVP001]MCG9825359.1 hypothetical protein [Staphylococcus argenteus]QAY01753.1 hypothetical protein ValLY3_29 [Vibrio phage ValLY_3]QEP53434.1 hypothetical protein HCMJ_66 [Vibrio phage vB_VpaS